MSFRIADWPPRSPQIEAAVSELMRQGDWGSYFSEVHQRLQRAIAEQFDAEFVRLCASGTAAVEMALRAAGVGPGDEVIVSAFDYPGNLRSVEAIGATPVLVDVAAGGVTPSVDGIQQAAGTRVKAVIVSHLFGHPADVVAIREACDEQGWVLIEDACQVPGMEINDGGRCRAAGTLGHLGTLSFGGSKPLTAGNGGAVLTRVPRYHARLKMLFDRPSDTFPLSALQAAVLLPQLQQLDASNRQRAATVGFLTELLGERLTEWTPLGSSIEAGPPFAPESANVKSAIPTFPTAATQSPGVPRPTTHRLPALKSCHYKFAFLARCSVQRADIIARATTEGLPLGEGFRSMHPLSERRCRKPVPLPLSQELGERLCVLDHRALMVDPDHYAPLAASLSQLHERVASPTT